MAEESFNSFPTPALGKTAAGSLRRHSTGKSSSLKSRDNAPHYLRASTGSCHDLCKYGKHVGEESQVLVDKQKKKATLAKSKPLANAGTYVPDLKERDSLESRKKAPLVKVKSMPISRTCLSGGLPVSEFKRCVSDTSKAIGQPVPSSDRVRLSNKTTTSKAEYSNMSAKRATLKPLHSTDAAAGNLSIRSSDINAGESKGGSRIAGSRQRKQWSLKNVSPNDYNDQFEVQEKTLYVINMETEKKPSESNQYDSYGDNPHGFDQCKGFAVDFFSPAYEFHQSGNFAAGLYPPSPSTEEGEEEHSEEESTGIETAMTLEQNSMAKMATRVQAEDTTELGKLSFRRGKVLDVGSEINDGPRILKFRSGRVSEEDQKIDADAIIRSFKPREDEGETNAGDIGSEQVVLRHQDVEEKKDAKGLLLNNVIEETASKLGGMQKSKVKALVGAFETVISLHDQKPSATTVS